MLGIDFVKKTGAILLGLMHVSKSQPCFPQPPAKSGSHSRTAINVRFPYFPSGLTATGMSPGSGLSPALWGEELFTRDDSKLCLTGP